VAPDSATALADRAEATWAAATLRDRVADRVEATSAAAMPRGRVADRVEAAWAVVAMPQGREIREQEAVRTVWLRHTTAARLDEAVAGE
jgi:hypothetical protein